MSAPLQTSRPLKKARVRLALASGIDCIEDFLSELRMYLCLWARLTLSLVALGIYLIAAHGRESAPGIAQVWYQEGAERYLKLLRGWLGKVAGKACWRMRMSSLRSS